MREIKFRGLNQETSEWVYGWYTKLVEGIRRFDAIIADVDGELTRFYIHNGETIGQFTGLYDKNGKEIYEGDIVKYEAGDEKAIADVSCYYGNNLYFCWRDSPDVPTNTDIFGCKEELEVIGNIHEQQP